MTTFTPTTVARLGPPIGSRDVTRPHHGVGPEAVIGTAKPVKEGSSRFRRRPSRPTPESAQEHDPEARRRTVHCERCRFHPRCPKPRSMPQRSPPLSTWATAPLGVRLAEPGVGAGGRRCPREEPTRSPIPSLPATMQSSHPITLLMASADGHGVAPGCRAADGTDAAARDEAGVRLENPPLSSSARPQATISIDVLVGSARISRRADGLRRELVQDARPGHSRAVGGCRSDGRIARERRRVTPVTAASMAPLRGGRGRRRQRPATRGATRGDGRPDSRAL